MNKTLFTIVMLTLCGYSFAQGIWQTAEKRSDSQIFETKQSLQNPRIFSLNTNAIKDILSRSTSRTSSINSNAIVSFPTTSGTMENFAMMESSNMAPGLAARYPEIKSYVGRSIENPSTTIYVSLSPLGLQAMTIAADQPTMIIEPYTTDLSSYVVFSRSESVAVDHFECSVIDAAQESYNASETARPNADDGKLRTFRLALSVTGEYTAYFGGTKALALAAMNNTMTRVNGVFAKDFGVHMNLIENNDDLIYLNYATDPYSAAMAGSGGAWNLELQNNLTAVIGNANYDIGHLFGGAGGGGNAGCIGCVCKNPTPGQPKGKGSGFTSPSNGNPSGDYFDIDYVSHEMGHQFGAYHTFTYANEGTYTQVEPGSGSTIMSYAGITGPTNNLQAHSDSFFHGISIQQVTNFVKTTTCSTVTSTGNSTPTADGGLDYTIPKGTPFVLTGSGSDSNNDPLTYIWEQTDMGNSTVAIPNVTNATGPSFRSLQPTTSPTRYFPKLATVQTGAITGSWESLSNVARVMRFRFTVRDNRLSGPANNSDDVVITVAATAGPFVVNSPNTAVTYAGGSTQTVTWNVAGTTANGVNADSVDILLSTDGGNTFPTTLASEVPNDGSQSVTIPNVAGTQNRIMVKGSNHVFFDISNVNFTITGGGGDTTAPSAPANLTASGTTQTTTSLSWSVATDNVGVTGYNVYQNGALKSTVTGTNLAVTGLSAETTYAFTVKAKDAAGNLSAASNTASVTTLSLADTTPPTAPLNLVASGTTQTTTDLSWTASSDDTGVASYSVYLNGSYKSASTTNSFTVTGLNAATTYLITVKGKDAAGNLSAASNTVSVTTLALPDTIAPTVPSNLTASATTHNTTDLSWNPSSDNTAVTGYNVYKDGTLLTTVTGTSHDVVGLNPSTTYAFVVKAKDAAGNISGSSNTRSVATLDLPDTTSPSAPANLTATATTQTTTNLSWTAATDNTAVTGYDVYKDGVLLTSVSGTSYNVSGLIASTTYAFIVRAKDAAGNISSASNTRSVTTLAIPDTTAPTAPTNLAASLTTQTTTKLTWTGSTDNIGVTYYNIYKNGTYVVSISVGNSYNVTGLTPATTYSFSIKAKDDAGNLSPSSNTVSVTTLSVPDTTIPSTPTNLVASNTTQTTTNLSWNASTDNVGVATYSIYRNGTYIGFATGTTYSVTGLTASTTYAFTVKAKDAAQNLSAVSNTVNVTTMSPPDVTAPTAPTNLTASQTTQTTTKLSWTQSTDNVAVTYYNIYKNGAYYVSVSVGGTYTVTGLTASTSYTFAVKAKDAAENLSASSNTVSVTTLANPDTTAPSAPANLTATNTTQTTTKLTWNGATDNFAVTGYNVYKNGTYLASATGTAYNVSGLTASTSFAFTVKAKDAAGNLSASSNTANVTTLDIPDTIAPTAPLNLIASNTTQTTTKLTWNASTDNMAVTGYNVYKDGTYLASATGTAYDVSGLTASTAYTFTVKAKDAADNLSASSNTVNVTTVTGPDTTAPTTPLNLNASNITQTGARLTWTASTDNVAVVTYSVYKNGTYVASATGTSYTVTRLVSNTTYAFTVKAKDAAGNLSAVSNTKNVTTLANADTSAPTTPTNLTASNTTRNSTKLAWTRSTDNVGVATYSVYKNGAYVASVTGTNYTVSGLAASTSYAFTVKAKDAVGNLSAVSNTVNVRTLGITVTRPSAPTGLVAVETTATSTKLVWEAATDDVEVAYYNIYQNGDYLVSISTGTSFDVSDLLEQTEYAFSVKAKDEDGNLSEESNIVNITTQSLLSIDTHTTVVDFKIYPNPVTGNELNISIDDSQATYKIVNLLGQQIAQGSVQNGIIPVTIVTEGAYILEITSQGNHYVKRFIKK